MKPLSFLLGAAVGWLLVRWLRRPVVEPQADGTIYTGNASWPVADGGVTYEPTVPDADNGWHRIPGAVLRMPDDMSWQAWAGYMGN